MQEDALTQKVSMVVAHGFRSDHGGTKAHGIDADAEIGGSILLSPGQTGYIDLDASNTPDFDAFVNRMVNGIDEPLALITIGIDGINRRSFTTFGFNQESSLLQGINTRSDLIGRNVSFIRMVVHLVEISYYQGIGSGGPFGQVISADVTLQFWDGTRVLNAGGQRSDVNSFLTFSNPLQTTTTLPTGVTSFDLVVNYSSATTIGTFEATLNGSPLPGFNASPGTTETVRLLLRQGRNTLNLVVEGIRADGRAATERDHLVFIVP